MLLFRRCWECAAVYQQRTCPDCDLQTTRRSSASERAHLESSVSRAGRLPATVDTARDTRSGEPLASH